MKKKLQLIFSLALMAFAATNVSAEEYVWDFSTASYSEESEDKVVWTSDYATLTVEKADASTPANNYLGGKTNGTTGNTITSSRFYKGSKVTIEPAEGYTIGTVVFECTTENYAKALQGNTWDNATAGISGQTVTITPANGTQPMTATIGGTTGSSKVTVTYFKSDEVAPPTITPLSGTYGEPQTVTITAQQSDATIYYTLNNGDYEKYTGPFTVSYTTEVSAYVVDANGGVSPTTVSTITIATFIYTANFQNNAGGFEAENVNLPTDMTYVWTNNSYGWVASAYVSGSAHESEAWLISPAFKTETGSDLILTFRHALNKGTKDACGVYVSEDKQNWKEVAVPTWPAGSDWYFVASGDISLNDYVGKTIYIGFKYASTTSNAPSWEIQELKLQGKGTADVQPEEQIVYNSIAEAKAAATDEKVVSTLKLANVTVAFVNGSSTYITDGTDGFLLYGSSVGLKEGQNVDITVTGQLYLYHKLPELSVTSVDETKVNSEGNTVEPVEVEVGELTADPLKYTSLLVKIEGAGVEEEAWESRSVTLIQDGEECVMYDNWNVATDLTFKTDKDYDITGFVAIRDENVQIYPRTAEDIVLQTDQALPASAWKNGEEAVTSFEFNALDEEVALAFTTDSDGEVTFESSDETVATVDEAGKITLVGAGKCVITAKTAETDNYQASAASVSIKVMILEGDGTKENPYTIADVNLLYDDTTPSEPVWITGYIMGCINGTVSKPAWTTDSENLVKTNFIISDNQGAETVEECIPMELQKGDIRDGYNLVDHPENLGQKMKAYGVITKYFSICGFKSVTEIIIGEDQQEPLKGDVNEDEKVDISDIVAVINQIAGTATFAKADVNEDKSVDISDIVAIINIIAGQE